MDKRHKSSNDLFQSIKKQKWKDVHLHLNEASMSDSNDTYALHMICNDPEAPINIVVDIFCAYPKAALAKDGDQCTPLYVAVDAGFEDAVHFLANACPEAIATCESSPIISAIYNVTCNNMIDSMIVANPEAAFITDNDGDSAFDHFFQIWNVFIRIVLNSSKSRTEILDCAIGQANWKVRDVYQKGCLFLMAANMHRKIKLQDDACLLHCAIRERSCHWAFCKLLMQLHPEQVLQRDLDGNLPIHIITACRDLSDEETFLCLDCFMPKSKLVSTEIFNDDTKYCCEDCFGWESTKSASKPFNTGFNILPVRKVHETVKELMAIAPQMAFIPDSKGRYPLHIAIQNEQSHDVAHELFRAFPEMVKMRDVQTRLLPFMLAAKGDWKSDKDQMTVTYQLLREDPHSVFECKE